MRLLGKVYHFDKDLMHHCFAGEPPGDEYPPDWSAGKKWVLKSQQVPAQMLEAGMKDQPAHYRVWSGLDKWEIYRWLCPGSELAARLYEKKVQPPADLETPDEFYVRHAIIPLVPVNDFSRAPAIKVLQTTRAR